MSIKRPMRIRCGIRSPQLARGACLLAMADSWRFWVKNSTGTSGRWRTFDHKPQPDELRITVQQSAVASLISQAAMVLWVGGWCREGESNPQGPKPGGF